MIKLFWVVLPIVLVSVIFVVKKNKINIQHKNEKVMSCDVINYSEYKISLKEYVKYYACTSILGFVIGYIFFESTQAILLFCLLPILGKKVYKNYLIEKRIEALNLQLKDFFYTISSYISTGNSMNYALDMTLIQLSDMYKTDDYIIKDLKWIVNAIEETNTNADIALKEWAKRTTLDDLRDFAEVYSICRLTGGDMTKVINQTSQMLIEKISISKEIKLLASQKRFEGRIMIAMPFMIILFIKTFSTGYLDVMYETVTGRLFMVCGLIAILFASVWSRKITNIEV